MEIKIVFLSKIKNKGKRKENKSAKLGPLVH